MTPPTEQPDAQDIRTVSFVSLGCPKNLVDSETMMGLLAQDGIIPVGDGGDEADLGHDDLSLAGSEQDASATGGRVHPADAVVINTCGFLEASKQESLGVIHEAIAAKERGEVRRVVVAGCLVQRHRARLLDWAPGIDAMVGVYDRDRVIEAVRGRSPTREDEPGAEPGGPRYWITANAAAKARELGEASGAGVGLTIAGGRGVGYFESDRARLRLTPRHYAYLRISEGCNQNCAFCTIPSIRGRMRSKPVPSILDEARELIRDGAVELLLIGQDTTSYGDDIGEGLDESGRGLPDLLRRLSAVAGEELPSSWLRLMYAYPTTFGPAMIDAFAELATTGASVGRLVPYLDIPLQHASDRMLELMRRNVTGARQRDLLHELRERVPGMAIRTTFITGFPGETEADHEALLAFIDEVGFEAVGVFRYSPEHGTPAGRMHDDASLRVPEDVVERRYAEIMTLQRELAEEQAAFLASQFDPDRAGDPGVVLDVLIDGPAAGVSIEGLPGAGAMSVSRGRTYFQAPKIDACTYVASSGAVVPGEMVRCTIVASAGYDLIARPTSELVAAGDRRISLPVV